MRLVTLLTLLAVSTSGVVSAPYKWIQWTKGRALEPQGYTTTGTITTNTATVGVNFVSTANIHGIQIGAAGEPDYYGTSAQFGSKPNTLSPYVSTEVDNRPTGSGIIQLNPITTITLTFSELVTNPVLAIMSTNKGNTWVFNSDFDILSLSGTPGYNNGYFGNGVWQKNFNAVTNKYELKSLTGQAVAAIGEEPHGTIRLIGTFQSVTWSTTVAELWNGFTIGIKSTATEALAGTGLAPAQGTTRCTTRGDPHIISFAGRYFDCHIAGRKNYYNTTVGGLTTTVDTLHKQVPGRTVMVNSDVYITTTNGGTFHAKEDKTVTWTPTGGVAQDITLLPVAANNQWFQIANGVNFIRNPLGVSNKFGVYIASAQLTVYFRWGVWSGVVFWDVEIIAVRLASDTGICVDESCVSDPPAAVPCTNITPAQIEAACAQAIGNSTDPTNAFCITDVSLTCDLTVALGFVPQFNPPAPLTPTSTGAGDPQFVGLQGQSFQVHGADDTVFALLSTPKFQLNSLFTYIGVGGKCNYNDTQCWSHPGTYMSQLGFRIQHDDGTEDHLLLVSGSHSQGAHVTLNGKPVAQKTVMKLGGSARMKVTSKSHIKVQIKDLFIIDATNSDFFFNVQVQLLRRDWLAAGSQRVKINKKMSVEKALAVYPSIPLHGLLGITWRNVLYPLNRVYEGEIMDYSMDTHDLFDTDFKYTQYVESNKQTSKEEDDF